MGRKAYEPTDEQRADVLKYAKIGVPHETIATIFGINSDTLKKHFKEELRQGRAECTAAFIGTLYELGNVLKIPSAVFFYLKTKEGYREKDPEQQAPTKTTLVLNKGATRASKLAQHLEVKDGTND